MNPYLLALILGIVEGVTEFLPVSSTAHLRIVQALVGTDLESPFWKMFTVVIQLGAVLCLPVYFWRQIIRFIATFPRGPRGDRTVWNHPLTLTFIAFVMTVIPAILLKKMIDANLESPVVWGSALVIGGVVMWVVDAWFGGRENKLRQAAEATAQPASTDSAQGSVDHVSNATTAELPALTSRMDGMGIFQAVWIGLCQVLAGIFPGLSRSMTTIAAGQSVGLTRATALEFSFFLSMPTMLGATVKEYYDTVIKADAQHAVVMGTQEWIVLAIGFVVSFFVAWAVVAWFMAWVRNRGFVPFAIYRIIAGVAVLIAFA